MSKNKMEMLGKVVVVLTSSVMDLNTIYDLLEKLDNADWRDWLAELKKFLRKEPCWELGFLLQGDQEVQFRWLTEQIVFHSQEVLNNETLGNLLRCAPCTRDFWRGNRSLTLVPYFVGMLLGRGVIRLHEKGYEVVMTRQEYEITYQARSSE